MMNGIEKITARITAETQADIDRILNDARVEASQVTAQYQAQANKLRGELTAKNEKAAAERVERMASAAQMEARKALLTVKQALVDEAYAGALEKLRALPEAAYTEVLVSLLEQASSTGREEVIFSETDREKAGAAAVAKVNAHGKQLRLSGETRATGGGFILKEQSTEVNCTFDTLVRLQKTQTAGAVAKLLFPES